MAVIKITKATIGTLASSLESSIEDPQDSLSLSAENLGKGGYRDAVDILYSEFFMGDSDLEHDCALLYRALPEDDDVDQTEVSS